MSRYGEKVDGIREGKSMPFRRRGYCGGFSPVQRKDLRVCGLQEKGSDENNGSLFGSPDC